MIDPPLAVDLYCGTFAWSHGWLAHGGRAVGFDIEHQPWHGPAPDGAQLVLQDVRTLHGSQFKGAALILASPPCQEFSYRAMPWKRAKALGPPLLGIELFQACFRIQREACEAAGRYIPMVVENVRGAQKWVGRAKWHFGSYYLWGDVPALMPVTLRGAMKHGVAHRANGATNFHGHSGGNDGSQKNTGGSWFNIGSPGQKETNRNPVHALTRGGEKGVKYGGDREFGEATMCGSAKSNARRAASAAIAKIPGALSHHIAQVYFPQEVKK